MAKDRASIANLKGMLRTLRGRQKSFYLPTGINDLTATASLSSGSQVMDIHNIDYSRFIRNREPKSIIRVSFTDRTPVIATITSSASHPTDAEQERLTVTVTGGPGWPTTQALATITRVEFLELVRFDADRFTITYPRMGLASLVAPVRVVFDDD